MKKILLLLVIAAICSCQSKQLSPKQALYDRLDGFARSGRIAYGHQDDLVYGHSWCVEDWEADALERSDVKDVCGQYPMVIGFDLGGIELGDEANLDGVPFGLMRKAAKTHVERGGIVTFSWHPRNPLTGGDAWDISSDQVVKSVLPGGEKRAEFMTWLERAADFIESLGPDVPVIFRPWHENLGSWFWWGGRLCTAQEYQELFRSTWLYFTKERGLENILWCYSPNGPIEPELYMSRYPGDEFVDILGTDIYEFVGGGSVEEAGVYFNTGVKQMLNALSAIGLEHKKLICLSETGLEGLVDHTWWTETLYPAIEGYNICYVLTWRNAWDKPGHFYAPWDGFDNADDFKEFTEKENIILL
jgi:mannan endo-1,4-beta-mannosidase